MPSCMTVDHRNRKWLITSVVSVKYGHTVVLLLCIYIDTGVILGLRSWDICCSFGRIWTSLNGLWNEIEIVWASVCVVLLRFSWWVSVYVNDPRRSISPAGESLRRFTDFTVMKGEKQTHAFSFYQPLRDIWAVSGLICEESTHRSLIICFIMNDNLSRSTLFSL